MTDQKRTIENGGTTFSFLETGDLYEILNGTIMINQLHGNRLDGSCNQLYLRVYTQNGIQTAPMIGSNATSTFYIDEKQAAWQGEFLGIAYQVEFQIAKSGVWFWQVRLTGSGQKVDVIYGQDIGNATKGAVRSNEAYMSQYVDHHVSKEAGTITISSRQNQPQDGNFPVIEQGSLNSLVAFSTDGYQFFDRDYKETNQAKALKQDFLANEVYQYEFAYVALQTETYDINREATSIVFYGAPIKNQRTVIEQPLVSKAEIKKEYDSLNSQKDVGQGTNSVKTLGKPIIGAKLTEQELHELFPKQEQIETIDGKIASLRKIIITLC